MENNSKYLIVFFYMFFILIASCWASMIQPVFAGSSSDMQVQELSLNGTWDVGTDRHYSGRASVPGLATDPREINKGNLWYRREVDLPAGSWTNATLILNGARFCPAVFVNGNKVSEESGGMTVTNHLLGDPAVKPGQKITLEIALKPLDQMNGGDASKIPKADLWRSNISSCLWDKVTLRLHGSWRINRLIPFSDIKNGTVEFHWQIENLTKEAKPTEIRFDIIDASGETVAQITDRIKTISINPGGLLEGKTNLFLKGACNLWSPDHPALYKIKATLLDTTGPMDIYQMNFGFKEFKVSGLGFVLNDKPIKLRAGTVVWHRWLRDPEAREIAFDTDWFEKNIVERLQSYGANTLRFHLGMPPEALLDLCDEHGLMVQAEWSFFHGMEASEESLLEQWRIWIDLIMRHPSVVLIHPWNETEGSRLQTAWSAIDKLLPEYPPLVLAHRDVIHIHKYWWSLFENLGLYYDSADQFDKPIMVDEFGGNYLDGEGNPGWYPTVKSSLLRFLGPDHTKESRMQFQAKSNARIAEYWRRLNAAGFSPFTILASPEDGNHWFLGPLREANPKPVWDALAASWSPTSVSLELWDGNFEPGEEKTVALYFLNDTDDDATLKAKVIITPVNDIQNTILEKNVQTKVAAHSLVKKNVTLQLPQREGDWLIRAILHNPPKFVKHPVISSWNFRTIQPKVPDLLCTVTVGIPENENELYSFLHSQKIKTSRLDDPAAQILLTSKATWDNISDKTGVGILEKSINQGRSVVMLDIGPKFLGQGYPKDKSLGPLQGSPSVKNAEVRNSELFSGITAAFQQVAEPESHLHPAAKNDVLWDNLDKQATWLWNGLRGGLIVPATDFKITGLSREAFLSSWRSRGADTTLMKGNSYFAYELQGLYAFSEVRDDQETIQSLRKKVTFMVEDAPALKNRVIPEAPVGITDLADEYNTCQNGGAESFTQLAHCGKNLLRTPVVKISFGPQKGSLILSQLLTAGRLARGFGEDGFYGIRYDPVAVQFVLNMLKQSCVDLN